MKVKINHKAAPKLYSSGEFSSVNIKSFHDFEDAAKNCALKFGPTGTNEYRDVLGQIFECFVEFWLKRYGSIPLLDVHNVSDTSNDKFNVGFDFNAQDSSGLREVVQAKFKCDPSYLFSRNDLGSFISKADEDDIPATRRILITNLKRNKTTGAPFHYSWSGALKQLRLIDRDVLKKFIDPDALFWSDFEAALKSSSNPPTIASKPQLWDHQKWMISGGGGHTGTGQLMQKKTSRGRIICATGGGKTRVEYELIRECFIEHGALLQVMVAPTIALTIQHHNIFSRFGLFYDDGVVAIHFRTGEEPNTDETKFIDYAQTTDESCFIETLKKYDGKRILVFTTYASEQKLFNILRSNKLVVDMTVYDEFHHAVKQDDKYKKHLAMLSSDRVIFLSASQKKGALMSSDDLELFGPVLADISFKYLRENGFVVPIELKPVYLDLDKLPAALNEEIFDAAQSEGFNPRDALLEAATQIKLERYLIKKYGHAQILTFSRAVPICKAITKSEAVKKELHEVTGLGTIHCETPKFEREQLLATAMGSTNYIINQHSVMKEGMDFALWNGAVFSRGMCTISLQQAAGRIVRIDPRDRENLLAGKISIESSVGWKKPVATIYFILHDDESRNYLKRAEDFFQKLEAAGITRDDWQVVDPAEDARHGLDKPDNEWEKKLERPAIVFDNIKQWVEAIRVDMSKKERRVMVEALNDDDLEKLLFETIRAKVNDEIILSEYSKRAPGNRERNGR